MFSNDLIKVKDVSEPLSRNNNITGTNRGIQLKSKQGYDN